MSESLVETKVAILRVEEGEDEEAMDTMIERTKVTKIKPRLKNDDTM